MTRALPTGFVSEINQRGALRPRVFIRFQAKNRDTGETERLCLWTGGDAETMTIGGVSDTYYGAGNILELGNLENTVGTTIRNYELALADLSPEIIQLLRVYEPKFAKVEIYNALMSTESGLLLPNTDFRRFKGWVDKVRFSRAGADGTSSVKLFLVSTTRNLTRKIPSRRSAEGQRLVSEDDLFFRYASLSGNIEVPWGAERVKSTGGNGGNNKRADKALGLVDKFRRGLG